MGTYAAYSLVAVVPTGLLLVVRRIFVYALRCKATKARRPITTRSAHPLALSVDDPVGPAQQTSIRNRTLKPVAGLNSNDPARETKLAS